MSYGCVGVDTERCSPNARISGRFGLNGKQTVHPSCLPARLTLYRDLSRTVREVLGSPENTKHAPIPMTGPYLSASSSALTATGHTRRRARHARKKRESADAKCRDCFRDGRRDNRVMAGLRGMGRTVLVQEKTARRRRRTT